ncbi:inhibitor of nuclear factor kappa-B kinase subunit epsilon isoform 1-T2 [Clarias gariepinus]|uniref:inhibitor of nuclear factor kappa-B kinase subunit epsilon n=1 Tax=Clarias gariepinus TaxID=13013 RepID=UPI00234CA3FE|nr:inhibitor of nuclear factor kappa-B kinase subunit epsilon [Clarias gariepinus]XP_053340154.1 inhibitor of nuclear factor kappa-B kinase subunit epsilon [Clarias gariepinus]
MTASTENHLWSTDDILGQGATASVYKARTKKTSEVVAVKVFNMASYSRPYEVQMREFEMLRRLNHVNIVTLFAMEELQSNPKQKVLVMEYCSGGSLLNLLEEPENAFGLPESEFLIVLHCVVHGMNHLRKNGVVHRDIKPGNIMRQVGEDGCSVYKLTDFGAARELEDDEKFVSIYGTEEYLHPDMYERAVLRKPQQKTYGVTVDLWSIGVTFYHAASGSLPFIPFGGPRRNKQTMYKITTEKPEGAIAGIQKIDNGPIEWSYDLPNCCQLSKGLRKHLVPVLANILEANQEKCWGFDQFFRATMDVLQRLKVHIFSLQQATAHTIYIQYYNTCSVFFDEVQDQTGIGAEMQQYLFHGHPLILESSMEVIYLPLTTAERPIFLLSRRAEKIAALPPREPEIPGLPSRFDVLADHTFSKTLVVVIHQFLRTTRLLYQHKDLILQGFYSHIEGVRVECNNATHKISMMNMKLLSCLNTEETLDALSQVPLDVHLVTSSNMPNLRLIREKLPLYGSGIREFQHKLQQMHVEIDEHSKTLSLDKCIQKMEVLLEKIVAIHRQYRKDKQIGKLNYNDEQIHKFEKINLSAHIKKVKALFRDNCLQEYQQVLAAVVSWSSSLFEIQSNLEHVSGFFIQLITELQICEGQQTKVLDQALVIALQRPAGAAAKDGMKNRDNMILRMTRLKDEMETLARELQNNNSIIENLRACNSTLVLEPKFQQPKGS